MLYLDLIKQLKVLQKERDRLLEDNYLLDARIDSSISGGNATGAKQVQYRLRTKGKPVLYLGTDTGKISKYQQQIDRGRQLKKLQKEIVQVNAKIERIKAKATKLGISLP